MIEIKPPTSIVDAKKVAKAIFHQTIFLAGSIEMNTADKWQAKVVSKFVNKNVLIFNPLRDQWDSTWSQEADFQPFREQVEWELDGLDHADLILVYFDPNTKSPISLLELGLYVERPIIVGCPKGFYRRGNVQIVCERYHITMVDSLELLIARAIEHIEPF